LASDLPKDWICRPRGSRGAHLVGIGGAGMRSLARVLLGWGWKLSGSDLDCSSLRFLRVRRVKLYEGHAAEHLPGDADVLIASDAVGADNPERQRAAELGIPVLSYFQALGRILSTRRGVAIAGTHGKSTTAAMLGQMLISEGPYQPTVIYGAAPLGEDCGGQPGNSLLAVVEACEHRANFLHLRPLRAAILGIEPDHFDYYRSPEQLERAFRRFAERIPADGLLVARKECPVTQRIIQGLKCRVVTFGWTPSANWSARKVRHRQGRYSFSIHARRKHFCEVSLQVPGEHNVLNALAAAALADACCAFPQQIADRLGQFTGLRRRLEVVGTRRRVTLIDDYAHHPTEVAAGLRTIRQMNPRRQVWCVFQPHQASRTAHLLDELAASLQNADKVIVAEVYRSREPAPEAGEATAEDLARKVEAGGTKVFAAHEAGAILELLESRLRPGNVVVTMGAGDIRKVCDGLMERLREDRAAG